MCVGGGQLAVFQSKPLLFQNAEELLDNPALAVPFDDLPRHSKHMKVGCTYRSSLIFFRDVSLDGRCNLA